MSEISIEKKNEIIASFMGGVKQIIPKGGLHGYKEGTVLWMYLSSDNADPVTYLDYHSDWSWLMPVVERIEKLSDLIVNKVWLSINGNSCAIWTYFDVRDVLRSNMPNDSFKVKQVSKSKIEAAHEAVYQFIQWYNEKQKEQQP